MLEIKTLGGLLIKKEGDAVPDLTLNKAQALLVYLVVEDREISRGELVALLWPESGEKQAMTSLRVILTTLRQQVGEYLQISRSHLGLKTSERVYFDGCDLETKLAEGDVKGGMSLYKGDFLTGFEVRDSAAFDEWRLMVQEHYRRLLVAALHKAILGEIERGDVENGLDLVGDLLDFDPTDEAAHRHKMHLLTLSGRRSAALVHYDTLQQILDQELGLIPSKETRDLLSQIAQDKIPATIKPSPSRHNLPVPQTSFIDRIQELQQIEAMIRNPDRRLLTLLGPGGIGKTRLAIQAAHRIRDHFTDGIFFVDLAPLSSAEYIIPTIADVLNFKIDVEASNLDPKNQLLDYLQHRSLLLVLDSFEHLVGEANLISEILQYTSSMKVLVTSRERLGLRSEWIYTVDGLKVPEPAESTQQGTDGAVQLFIERANQVNPTFQPQAAEMEHITGICNLVEGIPLGIELAAAWTVMFSSREIRYQIDHNLDLLSSRLQDIPEKHRSLRAVFDRSWDLLTDYQRSYFSTLSIFQGSFTLEAGSQVTGADLDQLSDLMDKSLLTRDLFGRFSMHNTLNYFASKKMQEEGSSEQVSERHARYYVELLLNNEELLNGPDLVSAREVLRRDIGNLRAAMDWVVIHWDQQTAREALFGYFTFYIVQSWYEGLDVFKHLSQLILHKRQKSAILDIHEDPVTITARVIYALFCTLLGFHQEGSEISKECLAKSPSLSLDSERSLCLNNLGVIAERSGEYENAKTYLEQSIDLGKDHPNSIFPTYYLWLGYVYFLLGDFDKGMACFQESYDLFDRKDTLWGKGFALSKMGLAADGLKEYAQAMAYYREALSIFENLDDDFGIAYTYSRLSVGAYFLKSYEQALDYGEISNQMFVTLNHRWGLGTSFCRIGFALLGLGQPQEAASYFNQALEISWASQQAPLSLYALVGHACAMFLCGDQDFAIALFNYTRQHPQTPALSVDMAEPWFEKIGKTTGAIPELLIGENGADASLGEIIDLFLQHKTSTVIANRS